MGWLGHLLDKFGIGLLEVRAIPGRTQGGTLGSISCSGLVFAMNVWGSRKFMVTLDDNQRSELEELALERHITIQQFLRAVVIPEWMKMKEEFQESPEEPVKVQRRRVVKRTVAPARAWAPEEANPL